MAKNHQKELETTEQTTATVTTADLPGIQKVIDITKFSSLNKLIAVTAYVQRFLHSSRHNTTLRLTGQLTVSELTNANLQYRGDYKCQTKLMVDLTYLPANQPITPFASNFWFTQWCIVAPPDLLIS